MIFKATLSSEERLKSRKRIQQLFDLNNVVFSHPIKAYYCVNTNNNESSSFTLKFGASVPKSLHRRAVTRNRYRRIIKEVYRLNKSSLLEKYYNQSIDIDIFFVYIDRAGDEKLIEKGILKVLKQIDGKIEDLLKA